ncbi:TPA: hypothetical protein JEY56_000341 [Escherichia coli]|nr:hypothetical protein [Escherichia coli]
MTVPAAFSVILCINTEFRAQSGIAEDSLPKFLPSAPVVSMSVTLLTLTTS